VNIKEKEEEEEEEEGAIRITTIWSKRFSSLGTYTVTITSYSYSVPET